MRHSPAVVYREPGARVVVARSFFRSRPIRAFHGQEDVMRAFEVDGGWIVAVANAYDSAFANCYPPGSRMLLDAFGRALDAELDAREAFVTAARAFVEASEELPERDEDFLDGPPTASLTVVHVTPDRVHCLHRGAEPAVLTEGGVVRRRLAIHSLRQSHYVHHLDAAAASSYPDVVVALIARKDSRLARGYEPEEVVWWAQPGVSLWLLSHALHDIAGADIGRADWPTEAEIDGLLAQQSTPYVAGIRLDVVGEPT